MKRLSEHGEINEQSQRAFDRWREFWDKNAAENKASYQKNPPIGGAGNGKQLAIFAYGPSFARNLAEFTSAGLQYEMDVMCVDKSLKGLIAGGVTPKYCIVADAQVDFEKYGKIAPEKIKQIVLIASATSNSKWSKYWTENGGQVYFFINKDSIRTHLVYREFLDYRKGEAILIPAASNVFNSCYVIASLILKYPEIYLFAADYSFKLDGDYYGDTSKPRDTNYNFPKHYFNNHITMMDINKDLVQVSQNMSFSARWLIDFVNVLSGSSKTMTVNCTGSGILNVPNQGRIKRNAKASVCW